MHMHEYKHELKSTLSKAIALCCHDYWCFQGVVIVSGLVQNKHATTSYGKEFKKLAFVGLPRKPLNQATFYVKTTLACAPGCCIPINANYSRTECCLNTSPLLSKVRCLQFLNR